MVVQLEWLLYFLPSVLVLIYWRYAYIQQRALKPSVEAIWKTDLQTTSVVVIVPFCNELHHLPHLLHDLQQLDIERIQVKFVLVNDHSTDGSEIYVAEHLPHNNLFHLLHNSDAAGKKQALATALQAFPCDVFCTLDADARIPKSWLRQMLNTYKANDTAMVVGQVKMEYVDSFIGRFQYTEWLLLQGLTLTSIARNKALLCNGASLLIERQSFEQIGGYIWHQHIPSGDDLYTMLAIKRLDEHVIAAQTWAEAAVTIQPAPHFLALLKQRLRWASKKRLGWDGDVLTAGAIVTGANMALLVCAVCSPFIPYTTHLYFMLVGIKCIADHRTVQMIARQRQQPMHELDVIVLNVVYPFYMFLILLLGKVYRPHWKHKAKPQ